MTQTRPPNSDLRECRLYRFYVAHPVTGERVLGYLGETWQMPFDRLMQHVRDQPWADTMLGWELDPTVYWGKAAVLEAERLATERERPLYPYENNLSNPDRIEIWRAKEQRWARDDAAGRPRWVPPVKKPRPKPVPAPSVPERRLSITARWTPARVKVGLWSGAWSETVVTTVAGLHHYGLAGSWIQQMLTGSVTATVLMAWSLSGAPISRKQRQAVARRWKRRKSWLDLRWVTRW